MGVNRHLPERYGSTGRCRQVRISRPVQCDSPTLPLHLVQYADQPAALSGLVTWYRHPLDLSVMNEAAQRLLGEHDFSAFRAASCQASSPDRFVSACDVHRRGDLVIVDITANAFLHHMVRNVVGSLLAVGTAARSVGWFEEVLASRDRTLAAETSPADGLYLARVDYPDTFDLPPTPEGPTLLTGHL